MRHVFAAVLCIAIPLAMLGAELRSRERKGPSHGGYNVAP